MSLTPSEYKNAKPFKAFIQQVLPTIYDDSLSYSELLYKVLYNMNLLVENNNLLISDIQKLYKYTNDYFENLDVQTEIDNKLEQMYNSGQLDTLFKKYLDPKIEEQNDKIDEELANQNNKIDILEGRMNTFSSLPDGSTAGDAELQDIRVGYNGKTYPNAGDAVRGQVSNLHTIVDDVSASAIDITNNSAYQYGVVSTNGEIVYNENFIRTSNPYLSMYNTFMIVTSINRNLRVAEYSDSSLNTLLSIYTCSSGGTIKIPIKNGLMTPKNVFNPAITFS